MFGTKENCNTMELERRHPIGLAYLEVVHGHGLKQDKSITIINFCRPNLTWTSEINKSPRKWMRFYDFGWGKVSLDSVLMPFHICLSPKKIPTEFMMTNRWLAGVNRTSIAIWITSTHTMLRTHFRLFMIGAVSLMKPNLWTQHGMLIAISQ